MTVSSRKYLFGGDSQWSESDWTASDDRVRGGSSISHLSVVTSTTDQDDIRQTYDSKTKKSSLSALFHGNLDTTTLGGAGFASQRTVNNALDWNLSKYDGIELVIGKSDGKRYAFILKDETLPEQPRKERSSLSWESEFVVPSDEGDREGNAVRLRWSDFMPTYRGKPKNDLGRELNVAGIQGVSIMMRSFFGYQEGDFELEIKSVAVYKDGDECESSTATRPQDGEEEVMTEKVRSSSGRRSESLSSSQDLDKEKEIARHQRPRSWLARLFTSCFGCR